MIGEFLMDGVLGRGATAGLAGLPHVLIVALQNNGGAIGNMICVNHVVSAGATTGTTGNEGKIIQANALSCLCFRLIVMKS